MINDVSSRAKFGVKGQQALTWLLQNGIEVPAKANHWISTNNGYLVMRLGLNEFLIEETTDCNSVTKLLSASKVQAKQVYFVPRVDASFTLQGQGVINLLAKICMLNVAHALQDEQLVMTQVAEISVLMIKQVIHGDDVYQLWCDGSYQRYLYETLTSMAKDAH